MNTKHGRHARISIFGKNDKNKICLYGPYTTPVKSWGGSEDIDAIFDQAMIHRYILEVDRYICVSIIVELELSMRVSRKSCRERNINHHYVHMSPDNDI